MSKNYNNLLDDILRFLLSKNQITGNFEKLEGEFPEHGTHLDILKQYITNDLKADNWEIDLMLKHLESEGFVNNELDENKNITKCTISLSGVLFIKDNGYKQRSKDVFVKRFIKNIETFAVIIGGIFAATYYLRELISKLL